MTLSSLKFDTPSNIATSLRMLAEFARRDELRLSIVNRAGARIPLSQGVTP